VRNWPLASFPKFTSKSTASHYFNALLRCSLAAGLKRRAVLVSIEAHRTGAWFPGPLSPYHAWFLGIGLSRDFERVEVPGNPMKSPFCFSIYLGGCQILATTIFASRQSNHVKHLLSGLSSLLMAPVIWLYYRPATPGARAESFSRSEFSPRFRVFVS
jgi:hypothetical protein